MVEYKTLKSPRFRKENFIFLLLISLFLYMAAINYLIPMFADDFDYSFIHGTDKKITNLRDVIVSQNNHYFTWGGRSVAHTIGQIFLGILGKNAFVFFNAFMFVALISLIYYHSQVKSLRANGSLFIITTVLFLSWFALPSFGETNIWLIGSCNYLWTHVIVLAMLLPYRLQVEGYPPFSKNGTLGMFLLGVIAGWTNENTASIMILLIITSIIYLHFKQERYSWTISGLIGALTGFCFLIFAPGNSVRGNLIKTSTENYSFFNNHFRPTASMSFGLLKLQWPVWILFLALISIIVVYHKKNLSLKNMLTTYGNKLLFPLILIAASFLNNLVMIASPTFPMRAGYGSVVFLIIGVLSMFRIGLINQAVLKSRYQSFITVVFLGILVLSMTTTYLGYVTLNRENAARVKIINENKSLGRSSVEVPPFSDGEDAVFEHVFIRDINENPNEWPNTSYAKYYRLKSIRLTNK